MSLVECYEQSSHAPRIQIFATDLNEALLAKARAGLYAKSLVHDVSPERLRRFFAEEEGGYRIHKFLREMVVFARQNVFSDPPFSRMDLVSCRNLLIYLDPALQKKVVPMFHYALKPAGFLLLGPSESIGAFTELFEPVDKKQKLYSKKPSPALHLGFVPRKPAPGRGTPREKPDAVPEGLAAGLNPQREADRVALDRCAPPGVLINEDLQVLQFRGATGPFLKPPTGKASFDLLKMARAGLVLPLRAALQRAKKEDKAVRREGVRIEQNGSTRAVNIEVIPLKNVKPRAYLVLFEPA